MRDIYHTAISWQCEYDLYGRHLPYYNIMVMWVWALWETFIILQYPGNVSMVSMGDIYHTKISSQCEYDLYGRHLSYYNILATWVWSLWETFIIIQYPGNVSIISVGDIYHTTISSQCEYDLYGRHLSYYSMLAMWEWSPWASCQIRKIACWSRTGNIRNVFPAPNFKGSGWLAIPICITARA